VTSANGKEALAKARQHQTYAVGYCLRFVRLEAWEIGGLYASAIDAWHGAQHRHPGDRNPPIGAPMFYAGGRYGHIVVAGDRADLMRSTDCRTSGAVSEADTDWPVRSWGQRYLGWTEDLNGIDLPLEAEEEEEMTGEDWQKLRSIVREEVKDEMNQQRPSYVSAFLAGKINDAGETVKKALRIGLEHAKAKT